MLNVHSYGSAIDMPFWWLSTAFGEMVFILFFITWGLLIIDLGLLAIYLVRKIIK